MADYHGPLTFDASFFLNQNMYLKIKEYTSVRIRLTVSILKQLTGGQ